MNVPGGRILDTRGSLCPQPILDLAAEIVEMDEGEVLTVLSDDPAFPLDVRAWCAGTGHELLACQEQSPLYTARIRRRARR